MGPLGLGGPVGIDQRFDHLGGRASMSYTAGPVGFLDPATRREVASPGCERADQLHAYHAAQMIPDLMWCANDNHLDHLQSNAACLNSGSATNL